MKVSAYIANFLHSKGIDTVFELQGGMITRLIDELHRGANIKIVSVHHEQAAAFAVDAYARVRGIPSVALATSGPGATNLTTGIGNCYYDSVPAIFITGQVNTNEQKGDLPVRQLGFQETDIVSVVRPITKNAYSVTKAEQIPSILEEAYSISMSGRMGPVLIDIAMDVQNENIPEPSFQLAAMVSDNSICDDLGPFTQSFIDALDRAKRPLVLTGRGIRASESVDIFRHFIKKIDLPVVSSLLGIDNIEYSNPNRIGFIGTYGNRWANYALGSCDLLLVLGSRLDLRQTGANTEIFRQNKEIFHVDIENAELNNRIKNCQVLNLDVKKFLTYAINLDIEKKSHTDWKKEIQNKYEEKKDTDELRHIEGINPNVFIHQLAKASQLAKAIITDVGNNQMWMAQSYEIEASQHFLSSGGMGAMGYSLPAAIGACLALKRQPVVCVAGDGGFQINIQELQTVKRNDLPVKIVLLNNQCLGMIRQFQDSYFDSCYQSTVWGYSAPDFESIAKAYGIDSYSVKDPKRIDKGLELLWENPDKPFLLNVFIDIHTNVFPKMMFGNPLTDLEGEDTN
jgi:acetolactate synthase-1/2/3 large subunit